MGMSSSESNQLNAYLRTFSEVSDVVDSTYSPPKCNPVLLSLSSSSACIVAFFLHGANELFEGFLQDIILIMNLHSTALVELGISISLTLPGTDRPLPETSHTAPKTTADVFRRSVVVLLWIILVLTHSKSNISGLLGCYFHLISHALQPILGFLIIAPIVLGVCIDRQIRGLLVKVKRADSSTSAVLGWIKRLQLTSMGRHIAHPFPPIAKMEESLAGVNGYMVLTCPEMRKALHHALLTFHRNIFSAVTNFTGDSKMDFGECFQNDQYVVQSINQLQTLYSKIFRRLVPLCFRCILLSIRLQSDSNNSKRVTCPNSLISIMKLPAFLLDISCAVRVLQQMIHLISCPMSESNGEITLFDTVLSDMKTKIMCLENTSVTYEWKDTLDKQHAAALSSYLNMRVQIQRTRTGLEGMISQLWLCEKELSTLDLGNFFDISRKNVLQNSSAQELSRANSSTGNEIDIMSTASKSEKNGEVNNSSLNDNNVKESAHRTNSDDKTDGHRERRDEVLFKLNQVVKYILIENAYSDSEEAVKNILQHAESLINILHRKETANKLPLNSVEKSINCAPTEFEQHSLSPRKKENCASVLFESETDDFVDNVSEQLSGTSSRVRNNPDDIGVARRIVDVYTATVPTRQDRDISKMKNEKDTPQNTALMNANFNSKKLLSELNDHIKMMDMNTKIEERIKVSCLPIDMKELDDATHPNLKSVNTSYKPDIFLDENVLQKNILQNNIPQKHVLLENLAVAQVNMKYADSKSAPGDDVVSATCNQPDHSEKGTTEYFDVPTTGHETSQVNTGNYGFCNLSSELNRRLSVLGNTEDVLFTIFGDDDDDVGDDGKGVDSDVDYYISDNCRDIDPLISTTSDQQCMKNKTDANNHFFYPDNDQECSLQSDNVKENSLDSDYIKVEIDTFPGIQY